VPLRCQDCGKEFETRINTKKFCSAVCRTHAYVKRVGIEGKCTYCQKPIKIAPTDIERYKRHFCSRACKQGFKIANNFAGNLQDSLGLRRRHTERIRAMLRINSQLECVNCGCNDLRILEINHINGGGGKDYKKHKNKPELIYYAILRGERKTDDLNLLCRVCNALHYAELKGVRGFTVTYQKA
jgi:hypothetical protein